MAVFPSRVTIRKLPRCAKQQLVATAAIAAGEEVICEAPLVSIDLMPSFRYGDYCYDLTDMLLRDPALLKAVRSCHLWSTPQLLDPQSLEVEAELVKVHRKSRALVRELHAMVATNNIGIVSDSGVVRGYGLFAVLSHSDHSCDPSCRLAPGAGPNELRLLAKRDLRPGEAVTWSYFREEEFLPADFDTRNEALVNIFRFSCRCARCVAERPASLAGVRDLLAYYDVRLKEKALALAQTPVLKSVKSASHVSEIR